MIYIMMCAFYAHPQVNLGNIRAYQNEIMYNDNISGRRHNQSMYELDDDADTLQNERPFKDITTIASDDQNSNSDAQTQHTHITIEILCAYLFGSSDGVGCCVIEIYCNCNRVIVS